MAIKKYKTCNWLWNPSITEVEIEKETESSVWVNGNRQSKSTTGSSWFDTWQEGHDHIKRIADESRESVVDDLRRIDECLKKIAKIKEDRDNAS